MPTTRERPATPLSWGQCRTRTKVAHSIVYSIVSHIPPDLTLNLSMNSRSAPSQTVTTAVGQLRQTRTQSTITFGAMHMQTQRATGHIRAAAHTHAWTRAAMGMHICPLTLDDDRSLLLMRLTRTFETLTDGWAATAVDTTTPPMHLSARHAARPRPPSHSRPVQLTEHRRLRGGAAPARPR